ncbi:hypothetical protein O979_20370 [Mycobacterium avium subsp. paratuberculosis 10-4404]|nr:hypothetical protein O979_20370 [Mycobacterium avium subsp. paratuberculosis 10-4404]ETB09217.1 hypothetical protein O980_20030 [Mycobacterium avium subsp. paratuberculosis 08-8281]ETB35228.1 hypothetical protein O975_21980 [Mycobacterium avium subsp. paratuberculosis 11-1786]ETB47158.1 hypothetical protein O976_22280 [Mycobacterium avium subsp. paratuberculosis 10-8425]
MYLGSTDQLFACQQLIVGKYLLITGSLGHVHLAGHRQRNRPSGNHAQPERSGGIDEDSTPLSQIGPQFRKRTDHTAVGLHDTALQFGHITVRQQSKQLWCPRCQPPGGEVDKVELFLYADRPGHRG